MNPTCCTPVDHQLSRRQWLGSRAPARPLAACGLGSLQPALAEAVRKKNKQVLFIWLDGGMSQLESWDPKPNTPFGGPFRAIPTSVPGIHVSELLPRTAKQMHHLALVRSLCTKDNSHSAGVARIQRGDPKNRGVAYPFFGSAVAKLLGPGDSGLPPYSGSSRATAASSHQDAGFLGPQYGALALGDGKPPENLLRPDVAHRRRTTPTATPSASWPTSAMPRRRRKASVEANSYVFDMAAQLQKRIGPVRPGDAVRAKRRRALRHATTSAGTCCWPAGCSRRASPS